MLKTGSNVGYQVNKTSEIVLQAVKIPVSLVSSYLIDIDFLKKYLTENAENNISEPLARF